MRSSRDWNTKWTVRIEPADRFPEATALARGLVIVGRLRVLAGRVRTHPGWTSVMAATAGLGLLWVMLLLVTPDKRPVSVAQAESGSAVVASVSVSRVIDGDTIVLGDGRRVRLIGIDAPERGTRLGGVASSRARELLEGRTVRLEYEADRADRYGRALAHVWVDDELLSETLAREGLATVTLFTSHLRHADRLLAAQELARREGRGLWRKAPRD